MEKCLVGESEKIKQQKTEEENILTPVSVKSSSVLAMNVEFVFWSLWKVQTQTIV